MSSVATRTAQYAITAYRKKAISPAASSSTKLWYSASVSSVDITRISGTRAMSG